MDMWHWRKAVQENLNQGSEEIDESSKSAILAGLLTLAASYGLQDEAQDLVDQLKHNIHAAQNAEPNPGRPDPNTSGWSPGPDRVMRPEISEMQRLAGIRESDVSKSAIGHVDDERNMLKKNVYQMGKYCIELYKMLEELPADADLPHWWQSKIIKADDYVSSAKHYLENELDVSDDPVVRDLGQDDDIDPSGVS